MDCSILRHLWSEIEATQASVLLRLNDTDLVRQLLRRLEARKPLSGEECHTVSNYLQSRIPLIRDIAQARL